jgi:hypothetical protein
MLIDTKQQQISELLDLLCVEIQLSDTQYKQARTSYHAVAEWLEDKDGSLGKYSPDIYTQGSMALGTTVKPRLREEFDVDAVCSLTFPQHERPSSATIYTLVLNRLRQSDVYRPMLEPLDRCIRINYAEGAKFHLDIIPAIPAPLWGQLHGELAIEIPDREKKDLIPTNPKGLVKWFANRALSQHAQNRISMSVEPLPRQQESGDKAVLQRAAQLFKRRRDVHFGDDDKAPKSILLTTLNGYAYQGEEYIGDAVTNVLDKLASQHQATWPYVQRVENPTNTQENLARHWVQDKKHYDNFIEYVAVFQAGMHRLMAETNMERIAKILVELFDPAGAGFVKRAVKTYTDKLQATRLSGGVNMHKSSLTTAAVAPATVISASPVSVPRTSFFGD